ncbi:MAG: hypothetical protein J4F45_14195, partial [Pseudomonadales bacterium]|nr:hypothetical protein [Pseudomonadales bacterium]
MVTTLVLTGLLAACTFTATVSVEGEPQEPPAATVDATEVATVEGITEYRLPNGLRFLLFPD